MARKNPEPQKRIVDEIDELYMLRRNIYYYKKLVSYFYVLYSLNNFFFFANNSNHSVLNYDIVAFKEQYNLFYRILGIEHFIIFFKKKKSIFKKKPAKNRFQGSSPFRREVGVWRRKMNITFFFF